MSTRVARNPGRITCRMTLTRLLLYTLTALAAAGALYFFAIEMAAAGLAVLGVLLLLGIVYLALRRRGT